MKHAIGTLAGAWLLAAALGSSSAQADEDRLRRNIEVVFDTSGSMNEGDKIGAARRALSKFLGTVPAGTQVGLVVFDGGKPRAVVPLGPLQRESFERVVDAQEAGGPTPIADSMELAAGILRRQRDLQGGYGSCTLLVVTDGEETARPAALSGVVESIGREGMLIDVIGFGLEEDHSLKALVSRYRSADDEAGLTKAMLDALAETESYDEVAQFEAQAEAPKVERTGIPPYTPTRSAGPASPLNRAVGMACGTCSAAFVLLLFGGVLWVIHRRSH